MFRYWWLVLLAFGLAACGPSKYVDDMEDPKSALLVGHIETDDGEPMWFHWVQLKHTDPAGKEEYYTSRSDEDGMFYVENAPLGAYQIHRMGQGNTPWGPNAVGGNGGVIWTLGESGKVTAMRVKTPGVTYFGSFKYTYIEGKGFFGRDSFTFSRWHQPKEKELLQRLLKYTKKTRWEGATQARLAAIAK
jgi:hypothetical protein